MRIAGREAYGETLDYFFPAIILTTSGSFPKLTEIKRETGYLYFIDKQGDISRANIARK